ncbi:hypothetical protein, partial [Propionibacterium freudenreichii]|uniref:hypothetical protein n=1 Tax=Propionibacterium freudenreichii TaxID=1744 RepID=UPI001E585106
PNYTLNREEPEDSAKASSNSPIWTKPCPFNRAKAATFTGFKSTLRPRAPTGECRHDPEVLVLADLHLGTQVRGRCRVAGGNNEAVAIGDWVESFLLYPRKTGFRDC